MKKPVKKIHHHDGSTTLVSASGRTVPIPKGIYPFAPRDDFFETVRDRTEKGIAAYQRLPLGNLLRISSDGNVDWRIFIYPEPKQVLVLVTRSVKADHEHVGWAIFSREKRRIIEKFAAILPRFAGMGIYKSVLEEMKRWAGPRVLLSDKILSYVNILVWSKVGTYSEKHGRYKHNPTLTKTQWRKAVIAFYNRAYTA